MAFSVDRFLDELKPLFLLMGWKWHDERMARIYEEFMEGYEYYDLRGACKRMEHEEYFKYGRFKEAMDTVRADRLEREAQEARMKDEHMIKRMLHGKQNINCLNGGNCGDCGRDHCPIIDKDALKACFDIVSGEVRLVDANRELASKYHGIGFEEG